MQHTNIIKNIFIIILMGLLTSCGTFKEMPIKDINNIQESETELSLVLWQAPSAHHALAKTRTIIIDKYNDGIYLFNEKKYHISDEIILCVISIDEPLYAGKEINGQYIRIGTYTYTRADKKGKKKTLQTVAAFIRKEEFQKYEAAYLKEYFPYIEFFIKEPQPQENQN